MKYRCREAPPCRFMHQPRPHALREFLPEVMNEIVTQHVGRDIRVELSVINASMGLDERHQGLGAVWRQSLEFTSGRHGRQVHGSDERTGFNEIILPDVSPHSAA